MIPVHELTGGACNQQYGLLLDGLGRDWLRRGFFSGLLNELVWPLCGAALTFQLRQVQQYAALLPPGLRCQ